VRSTYLVNATFDLPSLISELSTRRMSLLHSNLIWGGQALVPRYLWQVAGKLLYHNRGTPAVSPTDPLGHARRQRNVRGAGWDPQGADGGSARGRTSGLPSPHGACMLLSEVGRDEEPPERVWTLY
jgi:hypothetical protein